MLSLAGGSYSAAAPLLVAIGLFVAVLVLVALCARRMLSNKHGQVRHGEEGAAAAVGNQGRKTDAGDRGGFVNGEEDEEEGFGEGGLWQKSILMGDKCRPPQFSGVIYYDNGGNRVPEMPRSPNVAPGRSLGNFDFPAEPPPKTIY